MKINKMPTKEVLEKFLDKSHGVVNQVYFDVEKGEFVDARPERDNPSKK